MIAVRRVALASAAIAAFFVDTASAVTDKHERQILLQAEEVIYDSSASIVSAVGHVEIDDGGRTMLADKVTYDQKADIVTASGHVVNQDEKGNVAFADRVVLKNGMREGVLSGFGALIGKSGRLVAASVRRTGQDSYVAYKGAFTPCKICNRPGRRTPVWRVRSERIVYDQVARRIHFSRATVDLYGVPVLYTPYLSMPDPSVKHASGILMPIVGSSATTGYFIRIPIYVAFSGSSDLTIAPMRSLNRDDQLELEYRQRWQNGGMWLQGSGAYNPNGGLGGSGPQTYGHIFGAGKIALDGADDWQAGYDIQLTSNSAYLKNFDISQLDRLVNDLFVTNESSGRRLAITTYYFQGLRATDNSALIPYILPEVDYTVTPSARMGGGWFNLHLNSVALGQELGPDSQRVTGDIAWHRPYVTPGGQLWTVEADLRGDLYHVDNDGLDPARFPSVPTGSHTFSRALPHLALDWRWPFLSQGDDGRSYILEPIALLVAAPHGGNLAGLPIEDSTAFTLDDNNIFSINPMPGYDLVQTGPRATVGFRAEALFPSGEIQAEVGQAYRAKTDAILDAYTGETGTSSDVIGRLSMRFGHFSLTDRAVVSRDDGSIERNELFAKTDFGRNALEASYVYLPANAMAGLVRQEQVNAQADVNLFGNWQLFGAIQDDALTGKLLNAEYAIGWQNDCFGFALGIHRRYTRDLQQGVPPSSDLIWRFNLQADGEPPQPSRLFPDDTFTRVHQ